LTRLIWWGRLYHPGSRRPWRIRQLETIAHTYRQFALLLLSASFIYLSFLIIQPFLTPITWATALTILVYPLFLRLEKLIHAPAVRATILVSALAIIIIAPTIWMSRELVNAGIKGIATIFPMATHDAWTEFTRSYPRAGEWAIFLEDTFHILEVSSELVSILRHRTTQVLTLSFMGLGYTLLTLFISFFLLRDGRAFVSGMKRLLPLPDTSVDAIFSKITDTIYATLFGIVAVSLVQGFLGGVLFWWLRIPGAVIWATIMALLAVIPYLGAFIVWIPVAVFLALKSQWTVAVATCVWGIIVIGLSDNVLYPVLVGKRLHYHSLIVFFSILGGIVVFGAAGLVLGPVVLAVSDCLLRIWRDEPIVSTGHPAPLGPQATGSGGSPAEPIA